jgi:hypothetical protein
MLDGLVMFGNAVVGYLNPVSLALAFGATLLGVVAGCMPGLSATLVITLLTTLTLKMQPNQAITFPARQRTPPLASTATNSRARGKRAAPWGSPRPARSSARCSASSV